MNCQEFIEKLDDYLDGERTNTEHQTATAHTRDCSACQQRLADRGALRSALRGLPTPAPRHGFFDEALNRAYRSHPHWRRSYVAATALAASLALWIGFGWFPNSLRQSEKPANVTISLTEPRTIQLSFNADHELSQAMVDIRLPDGVELQGYPGQRQIRWQTDLAQGVNVLSLPLIAVSSSGGVMLARLEHGDRSTELAVQLRVNERGHSNSNIRRSTDARV